MVDRTLKHYRIVAPIGAGGMGEVYRAHDERLDRDVALKVLPSGALADEVARKRFRKEAHALSRVSHPHVATLHDFDTEGGVDFLVMELVPGPSLEAELKRGPLPEKDVVRLGAQIVRGLVAAHEHGVIHRDLKPSNIRLTPDGLVKVLDFGLARVAQPTQTDDTTETASGGTAGTPPYMSPEQLLGKDVDARTDVYAAGAVLYEMATGRKPFGEARGPELVAAILKETPPSPREVKPELSAVLESVILKATDKDPTLRYQSAKELLVDLERVALGESPSAHVRASNAEDADVRAGKDSNRESRAGGTVHRARPRWGRAIVGAGLLVAVMALALWLPGAREPRITAVRRLVPGVGFLNGLETDGENAYYVEVHRPTDRLMSVPLAGGIPRPIPLPWSGPLSLGLMSIRDTPPDFLLRREDQLWRLPVRGGAASRLVGIEGIYLSAHWSRRGDRLAWIERDEAHDRLFVGDAEGRDRRLILEVPVGPGQFRGVIMLGWWPSDEFIRCWKMESGELFDVPSTGGASRPAPPGAGVFWGAPEWTPDGSYFLVPTDSGLTGHPESRTLFRRTSPVSIAAPTNLHLPRFTPDGQHLLAGVHRPGTEVVRVDTASRALGSLLGGARAGVAAFSPDGSRVAWVSNDGERVELGRLWLSRPDGTERLQLSELYTYPRLPVRWSPEGRKIAFCGVDDLVGGSRVRVYLADPDEGGVELLAPDDPLHRQFDPCWSVDGDWVAYGVSDWGGFPPDSEVYLRRVDLATREEAKLPGSEGLWGPRCSADGRIVAYDRFAQRVYDEERRTSDGATARSWFKLLDTATGVWTAFSVEMPSPDGSLNYLEWSRDGRWIYASCSSPPSIVRFTLAERRLETLFDVEALGDTGWGWMGLDPTDAPLVHRDASQRDIVVMDWDDG